MLFHVTGTMCAGKSYLIDELKKHNNVYVFDMKDFYIEKRILESAYSKIDWNKFNEEIHKLEGAVNTFINDAPKDALIVIESTGSSQWLNNILKRINIKKTIVRLQTPSAAIIGQRARQRGFDEAVATKFRQFYLNSEQYKPEEELTVEEAFFYITEW